MHSLNKSKKKNKEIKIKIEKNDVELQPMSHYIDDRVELIKQVFSTLKTKTIRNLAPEFLKKSSIEEIEELCLNEILGISTKRLLSIMNATKCPTDTESSSDSDVHNIEEHISLEEISSDSEEEAAKKLKKPTKKVKKTPKTETGAEENDENDREISVLELLELQARARAIRSQLAQEPVTKIEVDSDESENVTKKTKETPSNSVNPERNSSSKTPQHKQSDTFATSNKEPETKVVNGSSTETFNKNPTRKIKLKRNFRKPQRQDSENETKDDRTDNVAKENQLEKSENDVNKDEKNSKKENTTTSAVDQIDSKIDKLVKDTGDENRKSPSPDVITILPSPETLFISDSSDDEKNDRGKITKQMSTKSPPVAVNSTLSKKEQNKSIVVEKRKSIEKNSSKSEEEKQNEKDEGRKKENETEKSNCTPSEDVEEGEILDHDDKETKNNNQENENRKDDGNESKEIDTVIETEKKIEKSGNDEDEKNTEPNEDNQNDDVISLGNDLDYEIRDDLEENQTQGNLSASSSMNEKLKLPEHKNNATEDNAVISKSESSSSEHSNFSTKNNKNSRKDLESNKNSPSKSTTKSSDEEEEEEEQQTEENDDEKDDDDVNEAMDYIMLHDSSEDELDNNSQNLDKNSQSWNERWLKSHKVKKILAQSRLSNRVRDKIIKHKKNEPIKKIIEEQQNEINKEKEKFESKFEDGSMQQYREIKEREQNNLNLEKKND